MCQVLTYFISTGPNASQHMTYFSSIGQNLHKLVNQRTLGVLTDTLINKLTLRVSQPGRWHNGSVFVFCSCSCTFKSEPSPTSAHACGEVTGCAPAAKRSASVAPEVDLMERTLRLPPQCE